MWLSRPKRPICCRAIPMAKPIFSWWIAARERSPGLRCPQPAIRPMGPAASPRFQAMVAMSHFYRPPPTGERGHQCPARTCSCVICRRARRRSFRWRPTATQANEDSYNPQISADGRYIVYETSASTLVANDSNGWTDVYLYDRQLAQTERVSVALNVADGNDSATLPAVSGDGRYVAFGSSASNLVLNDSNKQNDIFVRDRTLGQTFLVSTTSDRRPGEWWQHLCQHHRRRTFCGLLVCCDQPGDQRYQRRK